MKADGRGKAPKAGKGTGRKPLPPELKAKPKTRAVSVRLPIESIALHGIDSAWLFDAAMLKLENRIGLKYQQEYDPEYNPIETPFADQKSRLLELLFTAGDDGELTCSGKDCEIVAILQEMGVL